MEIEMENHGEYVSVQYDTSRIMQRNRRMSILLDISNFLASSMKLQVLLDGALSRVLEHFDFDAGRIYLMDHCGLHLKLAAYQGIEPEGLEIVKMNEGFSGKSARTRSFLAQRVTDLEDKRRVKLLLGKGYEMIVCVPLIALDEVIGVMNLATQRVIELDQSKIDFLLIIGNQIAFAINNALLYEDVKNKVKELKEKKETIKFFAYSASHDLKCPAVGLSGLADRFHRKYRDGLDDKGKDLCDQILKTSKDIVTLSEKINDYIKTREAPLKIEKVRIKEIAKGIRNEFASILKERDIRWSEPAAMLEIEADRLSILRFFQNCVDNALKYGGQGLSEIRIGHEENPDCHILSVSDNGTGMDPEDSGRVFELFQRHETSQGTDGMGLGLAIVKELAERHGGEVWVETDKGKGSTFFLSIPKNKNRVAKATNR